MIDSSGTVVFDLEKVRAVLEEAIDRTSLTVSDEDGFVWEADPEQTAILQEILDRIGRYTNNDYLDLQYQLDSAEAEIERLRGYEIAARDLSADLTKVAGDRDDQAARIEELESSLDEAEALTKKNAELMNAYLARIAELEDALVEERASRLSPPEYGCIPTEEEYMATDSGNARRTSRQQLRAEGKIGPDAKIRNENHIVGSDRMVPNGKVWQITEERKAAIDRGLQFLEWSYAKNSAHDTKEQIAVLWAMLEEDTHGKP